ncbi:MAG: hypothetical protein ACI841_003340 [Planctomycetota bacterium]
MALDGTVYAVGNRRVFFMRSAGEDNGSARTFPSDDKLNAICSEDGATALVTGMQGKWWSTRAG